MFSRLALVALPIVAWLSSCSDEGDERPNSYVGSTGGRREVVAAGGRAAGGGSPASGGTESAGTGSGGREEAGAPPTGGGEGGAVSATGGSSSAGASADFGGERGLEPFETPPLCPGPDAWSEGTRLSNSSAEDDVLLAITPDERTLVWRTGDRTVYADRESPDDEFGEATELEETGFVEVAVSPDGLQLVGTLANHLAFAELTREARDEPFSTEPDETAFADLNYAVSSIPVDRRIGDPLLPADGVLIFSYYDPEASGISTIREALGPPWSFGVTIGGAMLMAVDGKRRIATGLGADRRTLYYWDEVENVEQAAERAAPGETFDRHASLGDRRGAAPNLACDRLYYSAPGPDGDTDLFVATAE
jgi:hypothetical protein